jgi:hypothetical protein
MLLVAVVGSGIMGERLSLKEVRLILSFHNFFLASLGTLRGFFEHLWSLLLPVLPSPKCSTGEERLINFCATEQKDARVLQKEIPLLRKERIHARRSWTNALQLKTYSPCLNVA